MRRIRALWMRLRGLLAGRREDGEFDAESESHVTMHIEDGVRAGMSPEEARRRALIGLGGAEQTRQSYRERRTLPWLENLLRDTRYGLRGFRRSPVFTITAIATLALGVGATTAVFSVVDRILSAACLMRTMIVLSRLGSLRQSSQQSSCSAAPTMCGATTRSLSKRSLREQAWMSATSQSTIQRG